MSEDEIRAHQDRFAQLHHHDREIGEHDGQPWTTVTLEVGDWTRTGPRRVRFMGCTTDQDGDLVVEYNRIGSEVCSEAPAYFARLLNRTEVVDEERIREFAAADELGIEHDEVRVEYYIRELALRWNRDPERLAEEFTALSVQAQMATR